MNRAFSEVRKRVLDQRMDFKFFMMRTKVKQVYREALKEAQQFQDIDLRNHMTEMIKDEFKPIRRDRRV